MTTIHHPYTGTTELVETITGPHHTVRVLRDRFGYLFLQYLYSERKGHWRFLNASGDDMSHPHAYITLASARRRARRCAGLEGAH